VNYTVGQIVYLLSKKEIKVYPAQVVEEIKRKTISEELTSYIIRLPDKNGTEVLLEEVSADVFTSIGDLESQMMKNASTQIKTFLESAKRMESVFTPVKEEIEPIEKPQEKKKRGRKKKNQTIDDNKVEIDLGNGLKAKMDASEVSQINI